MRNIDTKNNGTRIAAIRDRQNTGSNNPWAAVEKIELVVLSPGIYDSAVEYVMDRRYDDDYYGLDSDTLRLYI